MAKKSEVEKKETENKVEKVEEIKQPTLPEKNADDALNAVVGNMSPIDPDVMNAPKQEAQPEQVSGDGYSPDKPRPKKRKPVKGVTDKHGEPFNADLHEVDAEGRPVINKKDGFLKMKPGRPKNPASQARPQPEKGASPSAQVVEDSEILTQRRYAADISSAMYIKIGMMIFGDEWMPRKDEKLDEQKELSTYFEKYFEVKGVNDIPPGAALALGLFGYAAARLHLPQTRSRLQIIVDGLKVRAFKLWNYLKQIRSKKNASYPHTRNDGERKNDTRPETSAPISN